MKRLKNLFITIVLLLATIILTSCRMIQEPKIKVSHDSNELKVIHYLNKNNKQKEDIEDGIKDFLICQ